MGLEPTNGSLGSYCLTTWQHPQCADDYSQPVNRCQGMRDPSQVGVFSLGKSLYFDVNLSLPMD